MEAHSQTDNMAEVLARRGGQDVEHKLETFKAIAQQLASSVVYYDSIPGAPVHGAVEEARALLEPIVEHPTRIQR